jgi:hypothetical protein
MATSQVNTRRQQGENSMRAGNPFDARVWKVDDRVFSFSTAELQFQYSTYKNTLQQLAQKIGDIEQETEEHK